jgi:hypothetical protein
MVKFAISKNLIVKSTMFPRGNIKKFTWTSPDGRTHSQIDHILIDRRRYSIHLWVYRPSVGPWPIFQFLNPVHRR